MNTQHRRDIVNRSHDRRAGRQYECLCGCGFKTNKPNSYRRNHTPTSMVGTQYTPPNIADLVIPSDKYRMDENGKWFYWWESRQRRCYQVRVKQCEGCGAAYLSRHPNRDHFCTSRCSNLHRPGAPILADAYAWRGGRSKNANGYVLIKVAAARAGKRGYVFEHRLVMERIIGRALLRSENVHHINGVRDDNRPENLELWTSSQPSGQRVADKLAEARKIIALYGAQAELFDHPSVSAPPGWDDLVARYQCEITAFLGRSAA